jgi:hypothetical protein
MKHGRIAVTVERGMFDSERSISFHGVDQTYHLFVDERSVRDGKLDVGIREESGDTLIVLLPQDTFTSGPTVRVPRAIVEVIPP